MKVRVMSALWSTVHPTSAMILVIGSVGLGYLDTSALYHIIRGQSVIKLYVMYNMLEVRGRRGEGEI